jgi:hypothetical protein
MTEKELERLVEIGTVAIFNQLSDADGLISFSTSSREASMFECRIIAREIGSQIVQKNLKENMRQGR